MVSEEKYYQVFEIDTCFDEWAMDYCLVGAIDKQDLISHMKEIFTVKKEECSSEVLEITEEVVGPIFDDEELSLICEDKDFPRITEVKNLYTDKPYEILINYSYVE